MRLEWELRLKMVYRLNMTFDLEVHLDGFRDTGLVKEYDYYNYSFHYHLLYLHPSLKVLKCTIYYMHPSLKVLLI